jgi:anti-sigma B factor antagonist
VSPAPQKEERELTLSVQVSSLGETAIVHCLGRIVYRDEAVVLSRSVIDVMKQAQAVVLDLGAVEVIDSAGLGQLVFLHEAARSRGKTLKITGVGPHIYELLELTKLDSVFEIYPNVADALGGSAVSYPG